MDFDKFQLHLKNALGDTYEALSGTQITQINGLYRALVEGNRRMNLTTILDAQGVAEKHISDSILPIKSGLFSDGDRVIDIGSGAGLPGLPLKIVKPDLDVTLLDATEKKTVFIKETAQALGVDVSVINDRAEAAAHQDLTREKFDVCVSRAVAPLNILLELCAGFIKNGGSIVAYKGEKAKEEIVQATRCAGMLGLSLEKIVQSEDNKNRHCVVVYHKQKMTPDKYPRQYARIKKQPL